jgi:chemotaxis protein MotB
MNRADFAADHALGYAGASGYDEAGGGDEDNWLISYADLLTNLLAFFVLLLGVSSIQTYRFEALSSSFSQRQRPSMTDLKAGLDRYIRAQSLERDLETAIDEQGLAVRFRTKLLFDSAQSELSREGEQLLESLAAVMRPYADRYDIVVEGHADDLPIHNQSFASNWELSAQRSVNVVKKLIAVGLDRRRLSAQAFADTRPTATPAVDGDLEKSRAQNRRVVVRVR